MRSRPAPRPRGTRALAALPWLLVACLPAMVHAQPAVPTPAAVTDSEVRALIAAIGQSGCRFQRNGHWHDAARAQAHLQRKYDYARRRQLAGDAETFIDQAATRSSFSGRPYRVACPGQPEVDAGDWFRARLDSLRGRPAPR